MWTQQLCHPPCLHFQRMLLFTSISCKVPNCFLCISCPLPLCPFYLSILPLSPPILSSLPVSCSQSWTHNISKEKEFLIKLVKAGVIQDLTHGICGSGCWWQHPANPRSQRDMEEKHRGSIVKSCSVPLNLTFTAGWGILFSGQKAGEGFWSFPISDRR